MSNNISARRMWTVLLVFGLIGQIAWSVENMYFNLFVYNTIAKATFGVTLMVQLSGVAATVTTLLMGAATDRAGNRRHFISIGYIIWGATVMVFAAITTENVANAFRIADADKAIAATVAIVVVMDCVMTFFGSTANDAAFNAWVTDNTSPANRGKTESVLSALPLIGMLVVAGGFGMIVDAIGYGGMFLLLGGIITASGVFGLFFIKDSPRLMPNRRNYFGEVIYGFRPSTIKNNKKLYLLFAVMGVYGIATQVFMPYIIIFMQEYLGFDVMQYSIVLGTVILLAAAAVIVTGRFTDKRSKTAATVVVTALMAAGLVAFYIVVKCALGVGTVGLIALCIVTAVVMIYGYIMILALVGAMIRDRTPEEQAGKLQGVRLIFYVLLPMFIGPMIGQAINASSGMTYIDPDSGALTAVPSPEIFIVAAALTLLIFIPLFFFWKTRGNTVALPTKYDSDETPLPEYPRPQAVRDSYMCLNGAWRFVGGGVDCEITVPYSPETALSGVKGFKRKRGEVMKYFRTFALPDGFDVGRVILHFGAVDDEAEVFINGRSVCKHVGGYTPFSADITDALIVGDNEIEVRVKDDVIERGGARGKQSRKPSGIWYTDTSGIWQTVWLESVPTVHIGRVKTTADTRGVRFEIEAGGECVVTVEETGQTATVTPTAIGGKAVAEIEIADPKLWSPESPTLYHARIKCGDDEVRTYFALRTFDIGEDGDGKKRLRLNGEPYFVDAVLDQGYYSDGLYTPKSYAAFEDDLRLVKSLGFNGVRKHAKIEPAIWYEMCDRLGLIVWQDIVNGGGKYKFSTVAVLPFLGKKLNDGNYAAFGRKSEEGRAAFVREMKETVDALSDFPCVCMWTLFNEGWGQFDGAALTKKLKALDPTRVVDSASGWHDCGGELCSLHTYFKKQYMPDDDRPTVISEFGGYALAVDGHTYAPDKKFGYKHFSDTSALNAAVKKLYRDEIEPLKARGLSACVYTQLSDVEEEVNGLVTFDRAVVKVDADRFTR